MTKTDENGWNDRARSRMKELGVTQAEVGAAVGALLGQYTARPRTWVALRLHSR